MTVEITPGQFGIPAAPPGAIMAFASAVIPVGWLFCDGGSYNRTDYPELFTALGGTASPWGLPSGSTFQVPDLNGRTVIGEDAITYFFADQLGEETHVLTIAEMPAHGHNRTESIPGGGAISGRISTVNTQSTTSTVASGNTGGGGAHNNMQPSVVMHYAICTGRITSLPSALERYQVCTSSTRPAVTYAGLQIFETDTKRTYIHDGTTWKYQHGGTDPWGARVYRQAAFTLTVAGAPIVAFDTEWWDYGNNFATGTGRYTCPEDGQYRVDARASTSASASGERFICGAYKNAAEDIRGSDVNSANTGRVTQEVHGIISAVAGDLIDFRINQVNGTARGLDVAGSGVLCWMEISRA